MRTCGLVLGLACSLGAARGADAQEVLFDLPPTVEGLIEDVRADENARLRGGAQAELDQADRMPFSPGLALRYVPSSLRRDGTHATARAQLGVAVRAPAGGSPREAGQRSLNLGSALLLEPSVAAEHRITGPLLLSARLVLRLEWQAARIDEPVGNDSRRVAPLVGVAAAQAGVGLGAWHNGAEVSLGSSLWQGGAPPEYLQVVERTPRIALVSTLKVWTHLQLFLRLLPVEGVFAPRTTWTVGLAANLALTDD